MREPEWKEAVRAAKLEGNSEDSLKALRVLYQDRFDYGSDIGIIFTHRVSEIVSHIGKQCEMNDPRLYEAIPDDEYEAFRFRSAMIVPLPDRPGGSVLGVLAVYSPVAGIFNKIDLTFMRWYAQLIYKKLSDYSAVGVGLEEDHGDVPQ